MKERIQLISAQEDNIIFEKSKQLAIDNVFLLDKEKHRIDVEITSQEDNLALKNPEAKMEKGVNYSLWINDYQKASEKNFLIGINNLSIEGNADSIVFRKHKDSIYSTNSKYIMEGDIPVTLVEFTEHNSSLKLFNKELTQNNVKGFFAVNEETGEEQRLLYSFSEDKFSINLSEILPQGHWQLKVLYKLGETYLMDTVVEGDPMCYNKSSFIGYVGYSRGRHQGVYFRQNMLIICSLLIEEFFKSIPVDEREDIVMKQVLVHNKPTKGLELCIVNEQFINSQLKEIIFVSRKNKRRVRITTVKLMNGNIFVPLTAESLQEVGNNRWDLEAWFVDGKKSKSGRLQVVRETNNRLTYLNTSIEDYSIMVYSTMNNYVAILKSSGSAVFKEKYKVKTKMLDITKKNNKGFLITAQVKQDGNLTIKNILLKLRSHDTVKLIEAKDTEVEHIQNRTFSVQGSLLLDWDNDFFPLYWDIFITVMDKDGNEERIKVTNATYKLKKQINKDYFENAIYVKDKILYPYVTLKDDIAFMMRNREYYENKKTKIKEKLAYIVYLILKPFYFRRKDIWLGFEKFSSTAQDNGYAFFQYVDTNNLHGDFYFILDRNSSDFNDIKKESNNVVTFMSFKYFLLIYASKLLISSENKRHVYNLHVRTGLVPKRIMKKQSVFLQHGVTALKQSKVFKKAKGRGNFNLVIATSDLEKEIIHQNWKYELNEIAVTGFSRWDKLFNKVNNGNRKKIFVMPTWRTWMEDMPKEDFKRTDYYDNYISFLSSKELEAILEKYNLQLIFFLHPKFKQYISEFYLKSD
ncbi:CDP-glycerol glycerophosphotransferase family protein, partial [Tetragenococcus solitarius]